MLQRQHGFDQAGYARSGVKMPDIGLDRTDTAKPAAVPYFPGTLASGPPSRSDRPIVVPVPCVST